MNRRKGITLFLIIVLSGLAVWVVSRVIRQAMLDHALIKAILVGNNRKTLELLAQGANGEALAPVNHRLWNYYPGKPTEDQAQANISALLLLYDRAIGFRDPKQSPGSGPDLAVVRALLEHGARVNDRDLEGDSPLSIAAQFSNADAVRLLLMRGGDVEAKNNDGITPLMWADIASAKVLLDHGANTEASDDEFKRTPLMWAIGKAQPELVRLLLEHGAKVSSKDAQGKTALDYTQNRRFRAKQPSRAAEIEALLRKYGAK